MKARSKSLYALSAVQFFVPVAISAISAWIFEMSTSEYASAVFKQASGLESFGYFAVMPLAGLAILAKRGWSFPLFLGLSVWNIVTMQTISLDLPEILSLPLMLLAYGLNAGAVGYFLLPLVKEEETDVHAGPGSQYKTKPRFVVNMPAVIETSNGSSECEIEDISEGGALLRSHQKFEKNENVFLSFKYKDLKLAFEARVAHGVKGLGLQFHLTPEMQKTMKTLIMMLENAGIQPREGRGNKPKNAFQLSMQRVYVTFDRLFSKMLDDGEEDESTELEAPEVKSSNRQKPAA